MASRSVTCLGIMAYRSVVTKDIHPTELWNVIGRGSGETCDWSESRTDRCVTANGTSVTSVKHLFILNYTLPGKRKAQRCALINHNLMEKHVILVYVIKHTKTPDRAGMGCTTDN